MKRALKIAAPFLLIAAAFVAYYSGIGTQYLYRDTSEHWAREIIEKWSGYAIIGGSNGKFRPEDSVTRAELCTIITRVVPLEDVAENTFSDMSDEAWYAEAILKCVAAGILDNSTETIDAQGKVMRMDAFYMYAKALGLSGVDSRTRLEDFNNDMSKIPEEERPYIEALLEADVVEGRGPKQLNPRMYLTRAELVAMLDKAEAAGYLDMN